MRQPKSAPCMARCLGWAGGADRRVGPDVVDDDLEQRRHPAGHVRAAGEHAVYPSPPVNMKSLVTSRTVSVGPIGVSVPPGPSGAFHSPGDDRRRAVACERDLEPGDLREAPGGDRRVAGGAEPVEERLLELRAGEGDDHRAVAERQHGEHLAPGDLARLLTADGGDTTRSCAARPSW